MGESVIGGSTVAGFFQSTKFLQIAQTKHFADFIFEDRGSNDHTLQYNFRCSRLILNARKPQKVVPRN